MASYCEVCQGLYPSPHPHLLPVQWAAARRGVSWPRVRSGRRRDSSPASPMRVSRSEDAGGDVDGDVGPWGRAAYPCASPPLPPRPATHRSPYPQRSASSPAVGSRDGAAPPVGLAGAFQGRYRDATYCSLRRADGVPAQPDYLRRGEGRGCVDVDAYDAAGEGEAWTDLDAFALGEDGDDQEGEAVPLTSSSCSAPSALDGGTAQSTAAAVAAVANDVARHPLGHGQPSPSRASPGHATHSASPSTRQYAGSRHPTRQRTADHRGGGPAAGGAFDVPQASQQPASSVSGAPVPADASRTAAAARHPPRPEATLPTTTTNTRPEQPPPPQAARARESLADLVAKIRAEVSKEQQGGAASTAASGAHGAPDSRRHRRHRAESARPPARATSAAAGDVTHDHDAEGETATGASPCPSSASPTSSSTEARTRSAPAPTRHREHRHRSSRGHRHPHTSGDSATAARAPHRHSSRGREDVPRARRTASTSSSTTSSSSDAHLRRTVEAAELVLRRMQQHAPLDRSGREGASADFPAQPCAASVASRSGPAGSSAALERHAPSSFPEEAPRPGPDGNATRHRSPGTGPPRSRAPPAAPTAPSRSATPNSSHAGADVGTPAQPAPRPQRAADVAAAAPDAWRAAQEHRVERLREGLAALCGAVRKDLQKVREEVRHVRTEAKEAAATAVVGSRAQEALASAAAVQSAVKAAAATCRAEASAVAASAVTPASVVAAVAQCTPAEQRRVAALLLPHLRPLMEDVIQAEVRHQLLERRREQQTEQHAMEQRLHAYVAEAVMSAAQRRALAEEAAGVGGGGGIGAPAAAPSPPWAAAFSSPDALDAHLRATARAVLQEEDERRYGLANENERRHERRVQRLQEDWHASLRAAEARWRAEWAATLEQESSAWTRRARAPLQQHADVLQDIVTALTRDVTHLQEQQDTLSAEMTANFRQEREMRVLEQARLAERLEQRVLQLLPSEVDAACVRFHVQREQRLSPGAAARNAPAGASAGSGPGPATPRHSASAEELRLSVVQPALDHMRRLLMSHQEMLNASVEDRCQRAEHAVDGTRHVWTQNVVELRSKLSVLRGDVRGAFAELCESLNVAAPAL